MMDHFEKCLKVSRPLALSRQKQPMPTAEVHSTKNHLPCIPPRQSNLSHFAATSPAGPQRWEQKQIGFILGQHHTVWWQGAQLTTNAAFFSLAQGQGPGRSDSVSRHSPSGA